MKTKKQSILILLIFITVFAGKTFFGKGIDSGIENWRFYVSLIGFLILLTTSIIFYKNLKKDSQ
ncbi:hypothetical protein [Flavobacterium haoranii]|uniref:Uncharacterized protein n=1 Tax=Flavobacterium haoranii TaxID=683124 RepID=A0A1M6H4P0_9FLAO|nr:hypothetical protein [Flavobacterium haoranii]SHJ17092.1 hypothetical protein SAMN05444337_1427 [Flavobacterium haoranii]